MMTVPDAASVASGPAPASLPKQIGFAVIACDPSKPGPFALRVKLPPGTKIAPHTHATPETLTAISLWTDGEETALQVNGTGPFGLTYVNPADDPGAAK